MMKWAGIGIARGGWWVWPALFVRASAGHPAWEIEPHFHITIYWLNRGISFQWMIVGREQ